MLPVREGNQDLAVTAFAQRPRQLRLDEAAVLGRKHASGDAAHEHRMHRPAEQRVGRAQRQEVGSLRIGDHDLAIRAEHDEAVRHGIEGPVEARRDAVGLLLLRYCRKEDVAHRVRELLDRQQEGNRKQAENDMVEIPAQDEAERHRPGQGNDQDQNHARRAVIAPGDRCGGSERNAHACDLGKGILSEIDAHEAERAKRGAVQRAVEDVVVFALSRLFPGRRRRHAVVFAEVQQAHGTDDNHHRGHREIQRVRGFQVDEDDEQRLPENTDRECRTVAEQRFYKRDVNVDR